MSISEDTEYILNNSILSNDLVHSYLFHSKLCILMLVIDSMVKSKNKRVVCLPNTPCSQFTLEVDIDRAL